jgi:hypothetical protein
MELHWEGMQRRNSGSVPRIQLWSLYSASSDLERAVSGAPQQLGCTYVEGLYIFFNP